MSTVTEKLKQIIEEACDKQYELGFKAGYNARQLEDKEEYTHNLQDLYRRGYQQGYADAQADIGEVTIDDLEVMK